MWDGIYSQLAAMEALGVSRDSQGLNPRGESILSFIRRRRTGLPAPAMAACSGPGSDDAGLGPKEPESK